MPRHRRLRVPAPAGVQGKDPAARVRGLRKAQDGWAVEPLGLVQVPGVRAEGHEKRSTRRLTLGVRYTIITESTATRTEETPMKTADIQIGKKYMLSLGRQGAVAV